MIELDGSKGGGQIIRTALALSTITGRPFKAINIRKSRPKPGLKPQHIAAIKALKELCNAEVKGDELGSSELYYYPKEIEPKDLDIDIGTAGSITLLMQSLILPAMLCGKQMKVSITGGTCGLGQMPIEYFQNVFFPHIKKYTKDFQVNLIKRGYYPKGKGVVEFIIKPEYKVGNFDEFIEKNKETFKKIFLIEQGHLLQIKGVSHASFDLESKKISERQARAATLNLKKLGCPINIRQEYQKALSTGTGITCYAICSIDHEEIDFDNPILIGADSFGKLGKTSEKVGNECARELIRAIRSKAPVDKHLADNLIPFMAIFGGEMKVEEITNHTITNIEVCELFLEKKFEVDLEKNRIKIE